MPRGSSKAQMSVASYIVASYSQAELFEVPELQVQLSEYMGLSGINSTRMKLNNATSNCRFFPRIFRHKLSSWLRGFQEKLASLAPFARRRPHGWLDIDYHGIAITIFQKANNPES